MRVFNVLERELIFLNKVNDLDKLVFTFARFYIGLDIFFWGNHINIIFEGTKPISIDMQRVKLGI